MRGGSLDHAMVFAIAVRSALCCFVCAACFDCVACFVWFDVFCCFMFRNVMCVWQLCWPCLGVCDRCSLCPLIICMCWLFCLLFGLFAVFDFCFVI